MCRWEGEDGEEKDRGYMMLKREEEPQCGTNNYPLEGSACEVSFQTIIQTSILYVCEVQLLNSRPRPDQTIILHTCLDCTLAVQDGGVESVHVCGCCGVLSDNSYPVGARWTQ